MPKIKLRNPPEHFDHDDLGIIKGLFEEKLRIALEEYQKSALGKDKERRQAVALGRMVKWQNLLNKIETIQSQLLE